MIDLKELQIGDRVKIVDQWVEPHYENPDGKMDHWLGQVMTVKEFNSDDDGNGLSVSMVEDQGEWFRSGWSWYPWMFECLEPDVSSYDGLSELSSLFE